MLRITPNSPPAHSVDDVPTWIYKADPAWDIERVNAEFAALGDAKASHPVEIYYAAKTRFSLDAQITVPDKLRSPEGPASVTIEHYMLPGKRPTRFEIKPVGVRDWGIGQRAIDDQGFWEFARRGLVRVRDAASDDGPTTITPPRNEDGVLVAWMDQLSATSRDLVDDLGFAVYKLSKNEVAVAEGKP